MRNGFLRKEFRRSTARRRDARSRRHSRSRSFPGLRNLHAVWGAASNYHLCIDTSVVGVDGAVEIIMKFVEEFRTKNILPD